MKHCRCHVAPSPGPVIMPLSPEPITRLHRLHGVPTGTSTRGFKWFIGEPHDLPNHLIGYHFWSNAVPQLSTNPELRISMIPPGRCALATVLMLRNSSLSVIKP
jgi:hypothetical protein